MGIPNLPGRVVLEFTGHISQTIDANIADRFIQWSLDSRKAYAMLLRYDSVFLYIFGGSETEGFKHISGIKYVDNFTKVLPI